MLLHYQLLTQVSCAQDVSDAVRVGEWWDNAKSGVSASAPLLPGGFFMDKGRRP